MKTLRPSIAMIAIFVYSTISFSVGATSFAATAKSQSVVTVDEVNGQSFPAITFGGDETYLQWGALQAFNTPYEYLGNGEFAITGGTIQGIVYKGTTYLPWSEVAPKVIATKLARGGFNFTSVPVYHDYHIEIAAADNVPAATGQGPGSPAPLLVAVLDGNNSVPHQKIQITLSGQSYFSGYSNGNQVQDYTDQDGIGFYGINDTTAETVQPTITWTDPGGQVLTQTTNITFSASSSTPAVSSAPSGDSLVAAVPITIFEDRVLFNAKDPNGVTQLFQLDTGAEVSLVNEELAQLLNLPNLGNIPVEGVSGQDQGYISEIPSLSIGGVTLTDIPIVVDPSYTGTSLLGYQFFADKGYDLLVSQKHNTMSILQ